MGRSGAVGFKVLISSILILFTAGLVGCSGSNAVKTTEFPVPASILLQPAPAISLELGTFQAFSATPLDSNQATITEPITFQSSNTAVATVASNGVVCAGSWDSLTNPQVCTPGPTGVADITATAQGVVSPPTTVNVHQHVDSVVVKAFTPPNVPPPNSSCQSVDQNGYFEARAFNRGSDITSTVGRFTWQSLNAAVATLSSTVTVLANFVDGVSQNQTQVTAKVPGRTPVFATIGTATSVPVDFVTCRVESIELEVTGGTATSKTIKATVKDTLGNVIPNVPLTWSSSEPASVTASAGAANGKTTGGAATVIASCTPPTCNIGFLPTIPIYPESVVTVTGSGTTTTATVYVSSTGCGTTDDCASVVIPVTFPAGTLGATVVLPATPNSLVSNREGTKVFLGTNSSLLGTRGLAVLDAASNAVGLSTSTPGKVLAISPDGTKVVVSDTTDTPNQVFVFDTASNSNIAFAINGATAADFSPDSLKAYIVAGSTLYVYSKLDALQTIALTAPANDVTFLAEGAFAYLAGGDPSGVSVFRTCDNGAADTLATSITPTFVKTLPGQSQLAPQDLADTFHVIGLAPPAIDIISVHPPSNTVWTGCTPTVIDDDPPLSFDLGHGTFVAHQLIVSQDGSTAYVVTPDSILVFNITAQTSSALGLAGNAAPLHASLASDGTHLYVGGSDGSLHVIEIATSSDIQQIPFPQSLCQNSAGQPFTGLTCNPDLVAVKP